MAGEETPTPACHKSHCQSRVYKAMAKHPELLCLLIIFILSALSNYSKSYQPVLQSQPPPRRFFPLSSPVIDLYYGNLLDAAEILHEDEILFVMYYAPWCAQCSRVRWEFDKAARYMENEVTFVGINCWHIEGSCRQQNNFSGFPVMFAYLSHLDGFRYNGILSAEYMVQFLEHLKYPLTPLHTFSEVSSFISKNDNAVIGFFDFNSSPQPPGLQQFYCASLRIQQIDPKNTIEYGVISSKGLADKLDISSSKTIIMMRSNNETVKYPVFNNFTSSSITSWVTFMKQESNVKWLLPSGMKSLSLSTEIEKGPALIMFTPHRPLSQGNFNVGQLREIAAVYNKCENQSDVAHLKLHRLHRWRDVSAVINLAQKCASLKEKSTNQNTPKTSGHSPIWKSSCSSTVSSKMSQGVQSLYKCNLCFHLYQKDLINSYTYSISKNLLLSVNSVFSSQTYGCQIGRLNYDPYVFVSRFCGQQQSLHSQLCEGNFPKQISVRHFTDPFVEYHVKNRVHQQCRKARLQRLQGWSGSLPDVMRLQSQEGNSSAISGLACNTNKTLHFYAMNIHQSYTFLERLGVPITHLENQTSVVIFDKQEEMQYVLKKEMSQQNLVHFIQKFTNGTLVSHQRSSDLLLKSWRPADEDLGYVQEVTADTFHKIVLEESKDVVVLYYAPYCGFCAGFAHVYQSVAHHFRNSKDILFSRINAEENDLSWEYKVDHYPTIILFPARRKHDSIMYPSHLAKNLPNLVKFVSRYISKKNQLETGLYTCSAACRRDNLEKVHYKLQTLHSETAALKTRIAQLEQHILSVKSEMKKPEKAPVKKERLAMVRIQTSEQYIRWLKVELKKKELQSENAKMLRDVLKRTQGLFIDKNKLDDVVKKFSLYTEQLLGLSESDRNTPDNDISDILTNENIFSVSHDEL